MKPRIWWAKAFQTWQCTVMLDESPITSKGSREYCQWAAYGRGSTMKEAYDSWLQSSEEIYRRSNKK